MPSHAHGPYAVTATRIIVYAGPGSSHSWTWLADLFESRGVLDVSFEDADGFLSSLGNGTEIAIVSGGDGFAIASALLREGSDRIDAFIAGGGRYVGICAGAYLPLPSSIPPLSGFNLVDAKVENIDSTDAYRDARSPRLAVPYGSCSLFHPVRGELELDQGAVSFLAPLYGGPVFKPDTSAEVLLRYRAFTMNTEFQVSRAVAKSVVLGRPAAVRARHGGGELLLFGPHLEHPGYPDSNALFLRLIGVEEGPRRELPKGILPDIEVARAAADLRVAVLGLENKSFLVGAKLWDGGRFLELIDAVRMRMWSVPEADAGGIAAMLSAVRDELVTAQGESFMLSDASPGQLVEAARMCANHHFRVLRENR